MPLGRWSRNSLVAEGPPRADRTRSRHRRPAASMESDPHRNRPFVIAGAPLEEADGVVLLLHGRGATAEGILPLGKEVAPVGFTLLAPQAVRGTWYPYSFLAPLEENEPWLSSALALLGNGVGRIEAAGVPADRLVVAGFSQGACLATEFVARNPQRYGALLAFTGGLLGPPGTALDHRGNLAGTPVFLGAGDPDPHVPWTRVEETGAVLTRMGARVTLRRYPDLGHTVGQEELEEARRLVRQVAAT